MCTQKNRSLLLALIVFTTSIFLVNCSLSTFTTEDTTYLTPIPENTLSAYHQKRPIGSKLDAAIEATQEIYSSRMRFTQGSPKVIFIEETTLAEAKKQVPKDPGEIYSYEARPNNAEVWLVIFDAQWQISPPVSNDLLPLESGCIYVVLDANDVGYTQIRATSCQKLPN
jgi:hypothetical protein